MECMQIDYKCQVDMFCGITLNDTRESLLRLLDITFGHLNFSLRNTLTKLEHKSLNIIIIIMIKEKKII